LNGGVYVGRTSGYGNPYQLMMQRYASHHMRAMGYSNPELDMRAQGWLAYPAIRGREQQKYDFYRLQGYQMGNAIKPVSPYNPAGYFYWEQSNYYFGKIAPYTGE
jgi:hypothetical protein